ncbi:MAG: hypothetical protein IPI46_04345 [Bacteroidetes bacterium]|nr:hypothetical protein [Bacteroidota bacterium]
MNYLKYYTILIVIAICSLVTNQLMAAPIVKIISDKSLTLCAGDSVQLTADICTGCAAPYTFKWYKNDSTLIDSVQTIKVKHSGAYCVKVTCGTGCKVTQCVRVTIGFTNYVAAVTHVSCFGIYDGKIKINSPTNSSCRKYKLIYGPACFGPVELPLQASNEFTGLPAGNYCVKVIDTCKGCDTCICVTITQPPASGSSGSLTTIATAYTWPLTGSTFTVSGVYTTTLQNISGCDSVVTLNLTLIVPVTSTLISSVTGSVTAGYSGDHGLAVFAKLNGPNDVACDKTKKGYWPTSEQYIIADVNNQRIRKVDSNGVITTIAGTGIAGFSGDGGLAINAKIHNPICVEVDSIGNVYFTDQANHRVRKIDTLGIITTIAGNGIMGSSGDGGAASLAQLQNPSGVAMDALGNLFITENNRIRKVNTSGIISTITGNGTGGFNGDGSMAINASVNYPYGITADKLGNIFFADANNHRIRKIATNGIITTIAGTGSTNYNGNNLPATNSNLHTPIGVEVDDAGNVFIADLNHHRIRKVNTLGIMTNYAGNGNHGFSGDGNLATLAQLNYPAGIAVDAIGNLFVADYSNHKIRKVGIIDTPTSTKLNLSLYLQGYYTSNGMMVPAMMNQGVGDDPQQTDSITVELHESVAPYGVVASTQAMLYTNGNAVANFPPTFGNYYVVIKHRNSMETWSALPVACSAIEIPMEYKTIASKAYGNNLIQVSPGVFAIYSGDINQDENADLLDQSMLESDIANFNFGYFATDLNGDGNVDLLDSPILDVNINNFIFSNHP